MSLFKQDTLKNGQFCPRGLPQSGKRWIELQEGIYIFNWRIDSISIVENSEGNRWRIKVVMGQNIYYSEPSEDKEEIKKLIKKIL